MQTKPRGAIASIKWLDDNEIVDGYYFSFGEEPEFNEERGDYGEEDDSIFFYCDGEAALRSYMSEGAADFIVLSYELEF